MDGMDGWYGWTGWDIWTNINIANQRHTPVPCRVSMIYVYDMPLGHSIFTYSLQCNPNPTQSKQPSPHPNRLSHLSFFFFTFYVSCLRNPVVCACVCVCVDDNLTTMT